ncbi:MAG TPA: hypothetical protein DEB56_14790 [Thiobacillus sp.]|nr:hypothetical protein [Thiobacillus sp.]
MITTERRTVYIVRGKSYFDKRAAYRREAMMQLLDECAKECTTAEDDNVPSVRWCRDCGDRPCEEAIAARAGTLFERAEGAQP